MDRNDTPRPLQNRTVVHLCQQRGNPNAARERLQAVITRRPGVTTADLARSLDNHYSTARHHLDVLRRAGIVEGRRMGGRVRWFPRDRACGVAAKRVAAASSHSTRRRLLLHVSQRPGLSTGTLADLLGIPKSTASYHLRCLHELGALEERGAGRGRAHYPAAGVPEALRSLRKNP